jgi:dnd system-associated protein 4
MCFCACLGYAKKNPKPFEASAEPIAWSVFESRGKDTVVNLVAGVVSDDFDIVAPERFVQKLGIFESYANGGLEIIGQLIDKSPKTSFDVIRELILEAQATPSSPKDSIDEFAKDLTWLT